MAISFFQKIRLVLRGWSRRREEEDKRKQEEFLRRNTQWAPPPPAREQTAESGRAPVNPGAPQKAIDLEGLQAAYLDGSGVIAYYLDVESGEVVERRDGATLHAARFKRVPPRAPEIDDRRAFIETLEPASSIRVLLMKSVGSPAFRSVLASDRATERAWFNFRNDRAMKAVEEWLTKSGLR
ncbi:MAG: hypothetical protein ACXW29_06095 [Thermoanaerobaculia bacterium]